MHLFVQPNSRVYNNISKVIFFTFCDPILFSSDLPENIVKSVGKDFLDKVI